MSEGKTTKPAFNVYVVEDGAEGKKGFWTKVGAAWPHKAGKGFNVKLSALPLDGRLVLMEPKEEEAESDPG